MRAAELTGNAIKQAIGGGGRVRGVHLTFPSTTIIEVLADVGIDFVYLDGEHGTFGRREVEICCIAAERHGLTAIARLPDPSAATVSAFLDRGVKGLVVPHVDSVDDAKRVIEAAYFAPMGQRSFGAGRPDFGSAMGERRDYIEGVNGAVSVCIMIESQAGLDAAAGIAALHGVDYMSYGLNDLSQALGYVENPGDPAFKAVVEACSARIRKAGKPVREDFMSFAWINQIVAAGARQLLA